MRLADDRGRDWTKGRVKGDRPLRDRRNAAIENAIQRNWQQSWNGFVRERKAAVDQKAHQHREPDQD